MGRRRWRRRPNPVASAPQASRRSPRRRRAGDDGSADPASWDCIRARHADGRVDDQRRGVGHPRPRPAYPNQLPQQFVQQRKQTGGRPPQPATEGGGVGHSHPPEKLAHSPRGKELEVVEPAPSEPQQCDPQLHHQRGAEAARERCGACVEPAAQLQSVPKKAQGNQPGAVGDRLQTPLKTQRRMRALNVRPGGNMMLGVHRLDDLRLREVSSSILPTM